MLAQDRAASSLFFPSLDSLKGALIIPLLLCLLPTLLEVNGIDYDEKEENEQRQDSATDDQGSIFSQFQFKRHDNEVLVIYERQGLCVNSPCPFYGVFTPWHRTVPSLIVSLMTTVA